MENENRNRIEDALRGRYGSAELVERDNGVMHYVAVILAVIAGALLLLYGVYAAWKHFQAPADTTASVLVAVGKLTLLPRGEKPTVATITNLDPLRNQSFFKEANIGDKLLIFGTSKKAILYRPSQNRIITVAPLK